MHASTTLNDFSEAPRPLLRQPNRNLRRYAYFVVFMVALLILKGALVTSNNAGLAVPDWPTTFGENMFTYHPSKWVGIIFYEHVHRLLASLIGLLTVILAIWVSLVEHRRSIRLLSWCAVAAVVVQGVLGGLTVLYLLPPVVSASHGTLAQIFLLICIAIAYAYSDDYEASKFDAAEAGALRYARIMTIAIFAQLIIAALMRHSGAGLAALDFPTVGGEWIAWLGTEAFMRANQLRLEAGLPAMSWLHLTLHVIHRIGAYGIFLFAIYGGWKFMVNGSSRRTRSAMGLVLLAVLCQVALGIVTLLTMRQPVVTSLHVFVGALTLGSAFLMTLRSYNRKI